MSSVEEKPTAVSSFFNKTVYKITKSMLGLISSSRSNGTKSWINTWNYYVKNYRRTGINIREALLLSPNGDVLSRDGTHLLTETDIQKVREILVDGEECRDILHLENLYYCVKQLTDNRMVLFNGANYVMACLTASKHLIIVNIKARRTDGAKSIHWLQSVADDLDTRIDPQ